MGRGCRLKSALGACGHEVHSSGLEYGACGYSGSGNWVRLVPLTCGEREILSLLARGLSSARIAAALGIGARMVEMHFANPHGKPGLENRAQAAAWAATHGIGEARTAR
jgi:DNA-binding CsgD family transcriptional regulator